MMGLGVPPAQHLATGLNGPVKSVLLEVLSLFSNFSYEHYYFTIITII